MLVKQRDGEVRVALLSQGARAAPRATLGYADAASAPAHSQLLFNNQGVEIAAVAPELLVQRARWREGWLVFEDAPLGEACADVSAQTGVRFEFAGADLARLRLFGLIRLQDIDAFLSRESLAIAAERRGGALRPRHLDP